MSLPDDEKVDYLASLPTDIVWKMAEGNPSTNADLTTGGHPKYATRPPAPFLNFAPASSGARRSYSSFAKSIACRGGYILRPDWLPYLGKSPALTLFIRHPLNLHHVVVQNGLLAAIVPFDGHASPILFSDDAQIILIRIPANAVAYTE
jgi:hypothetical protein